MSVNIDLSRQVIGKINLMGHWQHIEYEGLHLICAKCGHYGHTKLTCSLDQSISYPAPPASSSETGKEHIHKEDYSSNIAVHGDWMIVQ